jgi:hypothetical protein
MHIEVEKHISESVATYLNTHVKTIYPVVIPRLYVFLFFCHLRPEYHGSGWALLLEGYSPTEECLVSLGSYYSYSCICY